jgi:hypothetical protein
LSQAHKTTWENCVEQIVPGGQVTTEQEVIDIHEAFTLTFHHCPALRSW